MQGELFRRPIRKRETPSVNPTVRGFDSLKLFREDSVIRIQQLQKDILLLRKKKFSKPAVTVRVINPCPWYVVDHGSRVVDYEYCHDLSRYGCETRTEAQ